MIEHGLAGLVGLSSLNRLQDALVFGIVQVGLNLMSVTKFNVVVDQAANTQD